MPTVFALVDCNNFYASCERLFRPDLKNTPIVVLSNNDGCVVARSAESKALGIKMGEPHFKIKSLLEQNNVAVFSSNYALYGDISARVMQILDEMSPRTEVYSIDEAFLDLTGIEQQSLVTFGQQVRQRILRDTGITVCVGIGPTKTLAKLANHGAKSYPATGGVVDLTSRERQLKLMSITPVNEIWGVGRKITQRLNGIGIHTALELANFSPSMLRSMFSVVLERTQAELNGVSCLEMEDVTAKRQQIVCSRSFGAPITELMDMQSAVTGHVSRAMEKARADKQHAGMLTVSIQTNMHSNRHRQYANQAGMELITPTQDTRVMANHAMKLLDRIWKPDFRYAKCGVMLANLYPEEIFQPDLFTDTSAQEKSKALMAVVDEIGRRGLGSVHLARQAGNKHWNTRREFLSPAYTTQWRDIPKVK